MKERLILFNSEMVCAILEGRKKQTRRVAKHPLLQKMDFIGDFGDGWWGNENGQVLCPYGQVGDQLWVRETWYYDSHMHELTSGEPDAPDGRYLHRLVYRATSPDWQITGGWKPSIFMPRWASRINLRITNVRVERVQDIDDTDALAEGVTLPSAPCGDCSCLEMRGAYRCGFSCLWDSINANRGYSWDSNPWVWVIEFEVVTT
jgi:hypothetical protein